LPLLLKRAIDIVVALIVLILAAPLMVVVAVAIKIDSPGPILYRSNRVGLRGQPVRLLKFRSMTSDAPWARHEAFLAASRRGETCQDHHKVPDDPRVTPVGRVIRKLSLDELPQLANVLRGEMSLVGPRPDLPYALKYYRPQDWARFDVLPGLTGLWQVSGRSRLSVSDMYELDRRYAEHWSIWIDLRILMKTVPALVRFDRSG
jgi:lipopolysaccharide/colanic/teichoic acid biosynthesis glycosyltransferase